MSYQCVVEAENALVSVVSRRKNALSLVLLVQEKMSSQWSVGGNMS